MDDNMQDLRQFIASTVHQEVSTVRDDINLLHGDLGKINKKLTRKIGDLDTRLSRKISNLDTKIDDLSSSVAKALTISNDANQFNLKDHERRITILERKVG